jgi:hypothetical protein
MNKYRKLLLNAMQFCSIGLLTVLVAASAGAQTSAPTLTSDERVDSTDALASAPRLVLAFVPSVPDPKPANSTRTLIPRWAQEVVRGGGASLHQATESGYKQNPAAFGGSRTGRIHIRYAF